MHRLRRSATATTFPEDGGPFQEDGGLGGLGGCRQRTHPWQGHMYRWCFLSECFMGNLPLDTSEDVCFVYGIRLHKLLWGFVEEFRVSCGLMGYLILVCRTMVQY